MAITKEAQVEQFYEQLVGILENLEANSMVLSDLLKRHGYAVEPDDFQGAFLITGPEDRAYLTNRYGVPFYPSTISIPEETWAPIALGGKGLVERLEEYGNVHEENAEKRTIGRIILSSFGALAVMKLVAGPTKTYHEDFHERFNLSRRPLVCGRNSTPKQRRYKARELLVLDELHAYRSDLDEGIRDSEEVKGILSANFQEFSGQIVSVVDALPGLQQSLSDRGLERLLLNAPSVDFVLGYINGI